MRLVENTFISGTTEKVKYYHLDKFWLKSKQYNRTDQ